MPNSSGKPIVRVGFPVLSVVATMTSVGRGEVKASDRIELDIPKALTIYALVITTQNVCDRSTVDPENLASTGVKTRVQTHR